MMKIYIHEPTGIIGILDGDFLLYQYENGIFDEIHFFLIKNECVYIGDL